MSGATTGLVSRLLLQQLRTRQALSSNALNRVVVVAAPEGWRNVSTAVAGTASSINFGEHMANWTTNYDIKSPQELIAKVPPIEVGARVVACEGGRDPSLGHSVEYICLDLPEPNVYVGIKELREEKYLKDQSCSGASTNVPWLPSSSLGLKLQFKNADWASRKRGRWQHMSTAAVEASEPSTSDGIVITESFIRRLKEIQMEDGAAGLKKMLRLSVEGGGCSGFLYNFSLDDKQNSDDRLFEKDGVTVVVDDISLSFVKGATVDFSEELIRASFIVAVNPNAASGCGCGASFTAKS